MDNNKVPSLQFNVTSEENIEEEEEILHQPPDIHTVPKKPALKHTEVAHPHKPKVVHWDEQNLDYNEAHRTATMKIDEPDTPRADSDSSFFDDDEGDESLHESLTTAKQNAQINSISAEKRIAMIKAGLGDPLAGVDDHEDSNVHHDGLSFEERRAMHYNEFKRAKQWEKSHPDDDDDDSDNEEEEIPVRYVEPDSNASLLN